MKWGVVVLTLGVTGVLLSAVYAVGGPSGPGASQMPVQMSSGAMLAQGQMPMNQVAHQMQQQMAQMEATIKALRGQLDRINPDLLTGQERPMYEYLKILQAHVETMHRTMGTMQG